jgi:hypothetical protein
VYQAGLVQTWGGWPGRLAPARDWLGRLAPAHRWPRG